MSSKYLLPRRTFLKGFGTLIALPWLEAMMPAIARAQGAETSPNRFFTIYFADGTYPGTKVTGRKMGLWYPQNTGLLNGAALPPSLTGLSQNTADFSIHAGLRNKALWDYSGGPGEHSAGACSFLTGCPQGNVNGDRINHTIIDASLDQVIHEHYKSQVPGLRNPLTLCPMGPTGAGDNGHIAFSNTISYQVNKPIEPTRNVVTLFNGLFQGAIPGDTQQRDLMRAKYRQSILDFVKDSTGDLMNRIGREDQFRVQEYLQEIREKEQQVAGLDQVTGSCTAPTAPSALYDKVVLEKNGGDVPVDYTAITKLMIDIAVVAFRCDLMRTGTLLLSGESHYLVYKNVISGEHVYPSADLSGDRHIGSAHHLEQEDKIRRLISIHRYEAGFFKHMLDKLKAAPEANGSLLDHSVVLFGTGLCDGNHGVGSYNMQEGDLPILVGGRGGGFRTGQHFRHPDDTKLSSLHYTILKKFGVNRSSFGKGRSLTSSLIEV